MYASWRNFQLALKLLWQPFFASSQKNFRPAIVCNIWDQQLSGTLHRRLLKMSGSKLFTHFGTSDQNESFTERDSGFISDRDLSYESSDIPFGNKTSFTVSVEGNIGSGKTTLLEYFKDSPTVEAIREPVDQWTNIRGRHNALQLLYEDPKRWSFSFNMYAQLTRVQMHMKETTKPIKMLERSLHSTRYCFVENDYKNDTINGMEYGILTSWYDWLVKSHKAEVDLIVYVKADPQVCFDRIKRRSRKEEALVPFSLIENLHKLHEEWLIEQKHVCLPAPVIVLDANREYCEMEKLYETHRQEILCGCT